MPKLRSFTDDLTDALQDKSIVETITQSILPELIKNFKQDILTTIADLNKSLKDVFEENVLLKKELSVKCVEISEIKLVLDSAKRELETTKRERDLTKQELEAAKMRPANPSYSQIVKPNLPVTNTITHSAQSAITPILTAGAMAMSTMSRRVPRLQGRRTVQGAKTNSNLRAVADKRHVFVGRLHIDTTPEELTTYLEENGITEADCYKLSTISKQGRTFKTSAFKVSVDKLFEELLFNEATWPENCIVREWVFMPKTSDDVTKPPTLNDGDN